MYEITKRFTFDSSHRLWDDSLSEEDNNKIFGKCANSPSHGHTYIVEVTLRSELLKNGMIVNFNDVKEVFKKEIDLKYDHHFLNDLMPFLTTAENIAKHFYGIMKSNFPETYKIRVHETPNSWAEYVGEETDLEKSKRKI